MEHLDLLYHFEHRLNELKQSGWPEEALAMLNDDEQDSELRRQLDKIRADNVITQKLEELWSDEGSTEIHELQHMTTKLLWNSIDKGLHKQLNNEQLDFCAFICSCFIRDINSDKQEDWKLLSQRADSFTYYVPPLDHIEALIVRTYHHRLAPFVYP
ncbi:14764_t:CDS:2 [Acaulospora colombiana]|uniref:14764_t:CDS:1 n=1 Tax=Acaulospora colombiana TaxID=27376 RepID=A0ACA9NXM1_9GLOM|nr:14764_t:CDS:2 [Acaulospora colombiana]